MRLPRINSLHARLILVQIACGVAVLAVSIVVQVTRAVQYEDGALDRGMQLYARAVDALLDGPEDAVLHPHDDLVVIDELSAESMGIKGRRIAFQMLDKNGIVQYRSVHAPEEAFDIPGLGFGEELVEGEKWRIYVAKLNTVPMTLVLGERYSERWLWATRLSWQFTQPLLWLLPIIVLGSWLASRYAARPLRRVVDSIAKRQPEDLSPIPVADKAKEVQPVLEEINRLLKRIDHARVVERNFFADAAHEVKTPLAVVSAQAYLLMTAQTPEEKTGAAKDLERSLQRTSHMVSQLLAFAAVESRSREQSLIVADLPALLADRLAILSARADEMGVDLSLNCQDKISVQAYSEDLHCVIDNLVDNAIRYNEPGGKVEVSLQLDVNGIRLLVEDDGPGVPMAERDLIFERFYRGTQASANGSGLGLAIVRSAVTRLGGSILVIPPCTFVSSLDRGVCFLVHIPKDRVVSTS